MKFVTYRSSLFWDVRWSRLVVVDYRRFFKDQTVTYQKSEAFKNGGSLKSSIVTGS
jgi:hypothetical protein